MSETKMSRSRSTNTHTTTDTHTISACCTLILAVVLYAKNKISARIITNSHKNRAIPKSSNTGWDLIPLPVWLTAFSDITEKSTNENQNQKKKQSKIPIALVNLEHASRNNNKKAKQQNRTNKQNQSDLF